ncbi:hybrid sensor histidine kinase/response regulator [Zemynaea arenosa]|nr:ATP-binding protein [Massilia arenosa]
MSKPDLFDSVPGEVAALMREFDWSRSTLGDPSAWPQSLRALVSFMLHLKFPMFITWGEGLAFLYNDAYAEVLGAKHPAALGQPFQQIWAEIWHDVEPLARRALSGEAVYRENLPLLMRRKGFDEQTWFTFSYSPVYDETGVVRGVGCTCIETTRTVLAERHQEEENERLRMLFKQAPGIMAVLRGPEHVFEHTNEAYLDLVGERDLIGKPVRIAIPDAAGQGFFELLDRVYTTGEPVVGRAAPLRVRRGSDGSLELRYVDFIYQPFRNPAGLVDGIFVEGSDVTEAVVALQELRKTEDWLQDGLAAGRMVAWEWSLAADEIRYSSNASEVLGYSTTRVDENWQYMVPEDAPRLRAAIDEALRTRGSYRDLGRRISPATGRVMWIEQRGRVITDAQGEPVAVRGINVDVTERISAENELKEASRRKDVFLAMLAHEIRNPLAPISTAAQLLRLAGSDTRRVAQAGDIISRQVRHLTELVDDLLDVSRVTRGQVELEMALVDIKSTVHAAIEQSRPLIETRHHVLSTRMEADHAWVKGDRTRLVQVVVNLLNNAAKYTPQGGQLDLSVHVHSGEVKICVSDNGSGIEPELLPHVFDLFTQGERTPDRSQGGLGIGLALVKSMVGLHGGRVEAFSDGPGKGATFEVVLPLAQADPADRPATGPSAGPDTRPARILVVDDNVDAGESLSALLEAEGHQVLVLADAAGALARADEYRPDVFILDIGLPDMSGFDLARALRARPVHARATMVALTGYGQPHDRVLSRAAGFDHHLVKPADLERLNYILTHRAYG